MSGASEPEIAAQRAEDDMLLSLFGRETPRRRGTIPVGMPATQPGLAERGVLRFIEGYRSSRFRRWKHRDGCPCYFIPTCTEYWERATLKYGAGRGFLMFLGRMRRCNGRCAVPYVDFP